MDDDRGEQVQILDSEPVEGNAGTPPGEIVEVDGDRFVVAVGGGAIAVSLVRANVDKAGAGEFARSAGLEAGAALGGEERSAA